jgi:hypothetical protein
VSDLSKLIDQIAGEALADPLRAAGYRKTGRTWRRRTDGCIQVVNVQGSRHSGGADGRFYLNLGVYFPALAVRLALFEPTDAPNESDCHLRLRVTPAGKSYWAVHLVGGAPAEPDAEKVLGAVFSWLDRRADRRGPQKNDRVRSDLREALEQRALPWLDRMQDLRTSRQALVDCGDLQVAAAASLVLGDRDDARRLLERLLAKRPASREHLREWGRANGVIGE